MFVQSFVRFGSALLVTGFLAACSSESSTSSASVSAIDISPSPCSVQRGDSKKLSAEATLPDGTKKSLASETGLTWSTANKDTATVNPAGIVVGVSIGVTKISVSYQGATGTIDCSVTP